MNKMEIINRGAKCVKPESLSLWVEAANKNTNDDYSKAAYEAAVIWMEALSKEADLEDFDWFPDVDLTGFLAGAAANTVWSFHSRGDEFKDAWNKFNGVEEEREGVINPAILVMKDAGDEC